METRGSCHINEYNVCVCRPSIGYTIVNNFYIDLCMYI